MEWDERLKNILDEKNGKTISHLIHAGLPLIPHKSFSLVRPNCNSTFSKLILVA